ncbi:MAG: 50S ribosomal protein L3 [Fibrobacter sp.]|nr:50S ribosomal protein L3 [Fibrobacter sp.]
MNGILAKKLGMTQVFTDEGERVPVTVLAAGPCVVIRHKTLDNDGYEAVQVGFGDKKEFRANKAELGNFKKSGVGAKQHLLEFAAEDLAQWPVGKEFGAADILSDDELVDVSGVSKGRGFSGTIRRHNFAMGPQSHGTHNIRKPGSIGANSYPARVFPGKKGPGQYGNKKTTVKNLQVVKVDGERNLVFLKGAVPGPKNGIIVVRKS